MFMGCYGNSARGSSAPLKRNRPAQLGAASAD